MIVRINFIISLAEHSNSNIMIIKSCQISFNDCEEFPQEHLDSFKTVEDTKCSGIDHEEVSLFLPPRSILIKASGGGQTCF